MPHPRPNKAQGTNVILTHWFIS